jgi:hypothetical protein
VKTSRDAHLDNEVSDTSFTNFSLNGTNDRFVGVVPFTK